eukprot:TRINITY_DN6566_c0_g3_i1.p1 TRINITY_DN6566_c0_g3~~TRINITY_DN6566_c0_g3_i1.p1  ORF type:complete len:471 (-),score=167.38 TRINITY_DN6566_c0_g3_i1:41-1393(-)
MSCTALRTMLVLTLAAFAVEHAVGVQISHIPENMLAFAGESSQSSFGATAPLNRHGYKKVLAAKDETAMKAFVLRVMDEEGMTLKEEDIHSLDSFVNYVVTSGQFKTLPDLKKALALQQWVVLKIKEMAASVVHTVQNAAHKLNKMLGHAEEEEQADKHVATAKAHGAKPSHSPPAAAHSRPAAKGTAAKAPVKEAAAKAPAKPAAKVASEAAKAPEAPKQRAKDAQEQTADKIAQVADSAAEEPAAPKAIAPEAAQPLSDAPAAAESPQQRAVEAQTQEGSPVQADDASKPSASEAVTSAVEKPADVAAAAAPAAATAAKPTVEEVDKDDVAVVDQAVEKKAESQPQPKVIKDGAAAEKKTTKPTKAAAAVKKHHGAPVARKASQSHSPKVVKKIASHTPAKAHESAQSSGAASHASSESDKKAAERSGVAPLSIGLGSLLTLLFSFAL